MINKDVYKKVDPGTPLLDGEYLWPVIKELETNKDYLNKDLVFMFLGCNVIDGKSMVFEVGYPNEKDSLSAFSNIISYIRRNHDVCFPESLTRIIFEINGDKLIDNLKGDIISYIKGLDKKGEELLTDEDYRMGISVMRKLNAYRELVAFLDDAAKTIALIFQLSKVRELIKDKNLRSAIEKILNDEDKE